MRQKLAFVSQFSREFNDIRSREEKRSELCMKMQFIFKENVRFLCFGII